MNSIFSLSCFLAIFLIASPPSIAKDDLDCVHYLCDSDWEYVKAGVAYRIGPPLPIQGGDLSLENTYIPSSEYDEHDPNCPRQVVVLGGGAGAYDTGGFFIFNPIVPDDNGRVPVEAPLAISSGEKLVCEDETGVLQFKRRSNDLSFWHITADGTANTSASCFQFLGYANSSDPVNTQSYGLQNCPYKCGRGTTGYCQNVGNVTEGRWDYLTQSRNKFFELSIRGNQDLLGYASI